MEKKLKTKQGNYASCVNNYNNSNANISSGKCKCINKK